jgi:hypothetical protein
MNGIGVVITSVLEEAIPEQQSPPIILSFYKSSFANSFTSHKDAILLPDAAGRVLFANPRLQSSKPGPPPLSHRKLPPMPGSMAKGGPSATRLRP